MTASYLFSRSGLGALAAFISPDTLFAFDLDGTLAPIVDDFSAARVEPPLRDALERLVGVATVCVISGRERKDVLAVLGLEPHLVIGNHGAQWPTAAGERNWTRVQQSLKWRERLHDRLGHVPGVAIEFKGESVSVHYRNADDREGALAQIEAAVASLDPAPRRIGGKFVVNLVPADAPGKGEALLGALEHFGLQRGVYFGDDETDEEVFRLGMENVLGVHIGQERTTAATFYLNGQSEMLGLLESIVGILELHREEQ